MPEMVRFYHESGADGRNWHVGVDGRTIDFREESEALRAARMLAGPGRLLVIDRRQDQTDTHATANPPTARRTGSQPHSRPIVNNGTD